MFSQLRKEIKGNTATRINIGKTYGFTSIKCYFGIWDSVYLGESSEADEIGPVAKKEMLDKRYRKDCLYYEQKDSLTIPGAEILQKRTEDRRDLKVARWFSIAGLFFAGIALLISAYSFFNPSPISVDKTQLKEIIDALP